MVSPLLQLCHVEEAIAVLAWQLKLGGQREHGLVEIPQHGFHRAGILMAVVYVVIQADELPTRENVINVISLNDQRASCSL